MFIGHTTGPDWGTYPRGHMKKGTTAPLAAVLIVHRTDTGQKVTTLERAKPSGWSYSVHE